MPGFESPYLRGWGTWTRFCSIFAALGAGLAIGATGRALGACGLVLETLGVLGAAGFGFATCDARGFPFPDRPCLCPWRPKFRGRTENGRWAIGDPYITLIGLCARLRDE